MTIRAFVLSLLLCCSAAAVADTQSLLPKPQLCEFSENASFALNRPVRLTLPEIGESDPAVDEQLTALVTDNGGRISTSARASITVTLGEVPEAEFPDEAYKVSIKSNQVSITAPTLRGAYWAVQTLWQLAEGADGALACGDIIDWAAFSLRGYTHDVGRGFLEFDELLNHIDKLSRYKINTFHWHLTENQGWRLESKVYPQLVADNSFTRLAGKYYTIEQAKQLVRYANRHGVTVIPEIDMPGHSLAFRRAMGHSMLTPQGLEEMKAIMTEACATFAETPWMHIGTDELRTEDQGTLNWTAFVPVMVSHIRQQGKKVVSWNPGYSYSPEDIDMVHMWSSAGRPLTGVPTIDSRYHYANHFDNYADIVSLYKSTIADQPKGSDQYAGVIVAFWNDRYLPDDESIIKQNSFFSSMLAIAERSWLGGGDGYFPAVGTLLRSTDTDFFDWERRFLFHKANYLSGEPIPYVAQTNMKWRITDPFPNQGVLTASFPPETEGPAESYTYNGNTYRTAEALGAGVYLRHVWGTTVPGFYANPQANHTAYAYTYVYSPMEQTVGLMAEFQNYSRSETDLAAPTGKWDYKGSRIWVNDEEIAAPVWENTHTTKSSEITLKNENMTARAPIPVVLHEGWNKVFMKLPVGAFTQNEIRLVKWMFNCVFTTPDGKDAAPGLIYDPNQSTDNPVYNAELMAAIAQASSALQGVTVGGEPGQYPQDAAGVLESAIASARAIAGDADASEEGIAQAVADLNAARELFVEQYNRPELSTADKEYWYSISSVRDGEKALTWTSSYTYGAAYNSAYTQQWKFIGLSDGSFAMQNRSGEQFLLTDATIASGGNSPVKVFGSSATQPVRQGWLFRFLYSGEHFAIYSGLPSQMHMLNSGSNYKLGDYGIDSTTGAVNTTDPGCKFIIRLRDYVESLGGIGQVDAGDVRNPSIAIDGRVVTVTADSSDSIQLIDSVGMVVAQQAGPEAVFQVPFGGIYLIKVGGFVRKIAVG